MNESYTKTIERNNKLIKKNDIISALIFFSLLGIPAEIQAKIQISKNNIKNTIEQNDTTNLLDKMNKKFGITLPSQYNENLKNFISNSNTLNYEVAAEFTENFISEHMSQNRGISKENQYLFIRCAIYYTLTNGELYDGSDGDEQRYNEYEIAFEYFLNCEENYKTKLKELIENEQQIAIDDLQRSRDNLQRSRDNLQRSRDNLQRSRDDAMKADTIGLQEITNYYLKYKQNPSLAMPEEVNHVKSIAQDIIQSCIKYGIDYKELLSPEVRRFYGIE